MVALGFGVGLLGFVGCLLPQLYCGDGVADGRVFAFCWDSASGANGSEVAVQVCQVGTEYN